MWRKWLGICLTIIGGFMFIIPQCLVYREIVEGTKIGLPIGLNLPLWVFPMYGLAIIPLCVGIIMLIEYK